MDRLEMMRITEHELGKLATAEQVAKFIRERFGEPIEPRFIPLIRASLRGKEALQEARERAIRILAEDAKTQPKAKTSRNSQSDTGSPSSRSR